MFPFFAVTSLSLSCPPLYCHGAAFLRRHRHCLRSLLSILMGFSSACQAKSQSMVVDEVDAVAAWTSNQIFKVHAALRGSHWNHSRQLPPADAIVARRRWPGHGKRGGVGVECGAARWPLSFGAVIGGTALQSSLSLTRGLGVESHARRRASFVVASSACWVGRRRGDEGRASAGVDGAVSLYPDDGLPRRRRRRSQEG